MTWKSLPMNIDCELYYTKIRKFTLVKETPRAIRIRLEKHPQKISIWMAKKITRGYTGTSGWFWSKALFNNIQEEEQKLKDRNFEDFNAIHVIDPTVPTVEVEKIIDKEIDRKNEI